MSFSSGEVNEFDIEDQSGVLGDHSWDASSAIGVFGRAGEDCLLALGELCDALIPALDDLADADGELEGLATGHARVENGAVGQATGVVHLDVGAGGALGASALRLDVDFE